MPAPLKNRYFLGLAAILIVVLGWLSFRELSERRLRAGLEAAAHPRSDLIQLGEAGRAHVPAAVRLFGDGVGCLADNDALHRSLSRSCSGIMHLRRLESVRSRG